MWRSGHFGDWDAEIAEIEEALKDVPDTPPAEGMEVSDDEGLGDDDVTEAPSNEGDQAGIIKDNEVKVEAAVREAQDEVSDGSGASAFVDENNNTVVAKVEDSGAEAKADGENVNLSDIELDDEICQIMDGVGLNSPVDLCMFKPLDLSDEEKEAMAQTDDKANLEKIDEAIAYCDAVLKVLHPEVPPNNLEVSVYQAEFKDEEEVQIITDL